jgi:uncharacterized membrane protein YebE (DUF533 family)
VAAPATSPLAESHPEASLAPHLLFAVVRTMVAAALADGVLMPSERDRIQEQLGSGELSAEQTAQVRKELVFPATPEELAAMAQADSERALLYRFAALVTRVDAGVSAEEEAWLMRLGAALGLDEARRRALEAELFGAPG